MDHTAEELLAFTSYRKRGDIMNAAGISRSRYDQLRTDSNFMSEVSEARSEIVFAAIAKMESGLSAAVDTLVCVLSDDEVSPQTRINAAAALIKSYSTLSLFERVEDLENRIKNFELAYSDQKKPF